MSIVDDLFRYFDNSSYNDFLKQLSYDLIDNKINVFKFEDRLIVESLPGNDFYKNKLHELNKYITNFIKNNPLYKNNQKNILYYFNMFLNSLKLNKTLTTVKIHNSNLIDEVNFLLLNKNFYKNITNIDYYHSMELINRSKYIDEILLDSSINQLSLSNLSNCIKSYPSLKKLKFKIIYDELRNPYKNFIHINLFDVNSLYNALELNKTLQTLKFNNSPFKRSIIYPYIDNVLKSLIKNDTLKKLDLYYFNIEDINLLIQLLIKNNTLEKIKLWKCNLKLDENLYCKSRKIIIYKNDKNKKISKNEVIVLLQDILKNKRLNNELKKCFSNIFENENKSKIRTQNGCIYYRKHG